jgi:hypothetical protein
LHDLLYNKTYDSLLIDLINNDIFLNSKGKNIAFSTLYDRSVFISNKELLSLELEYPKYKSDRFILNKNNLFQVKNKLINNNIFTVLDSKGDCYYYKEMLDRYPTIKMNDMDNIKIFNNIPFLIKENVSSFSFDKIKEVNKISEVKLILDHLYHDTCISILKKTNSELVAFYKYIKEVDKYIYNDIKKNINDLDEIKINNKNINKINKDNIIPLFMEHFEPNTIIPIEVFYKNGLINTFSFDYNTNKLNFDKAGIFEADKFGGEPIVIDYNGENGENGENHENDENDNNNDNFDN